MISKEDILSKIENTDLSEDKIEIIRDLVISELDKSQEYEKEHYILNQDGSFQRYYSMDSDNIIGYRL